MKVKISVIMSVYNTKEEYLREAIESIIEQTFDNFEFIIVDDGSDMNTVRILDSYSDARIRLVRNTENIGLTKSLNKALQMASGKYIARLDADDISYPKRLQKQYDYMERHQEIDVLACWCKSGKKICKCEGTMPMEWRRARILFGHSPIIHSSAFVRRDFLMKNHLMYDETMKKSQDYKLWADCMKNGANIGVCPEVLVYYRLHEDQISNAQKDGQLFYAKQIQKGLITELYPDISQRELEQFLNSDLNLLSHRELVDMIRNIEKSNMEKSMYNPMVLHSELVYHFRKIIPHFFVLRADYVMYRIKRILYKKGMGEHGNK